MTTLGEKLVSAGRVSLYAEQSKRGGRPLRAIATYCLRECCAGSRVSRRECQAEGCPLWRFRSGFLPATARAKGWRVDPRQIATSGTAEVTPQ